MITDITCVSNSQGEEDKDLGPHTCGVFVSVDAEGLESTEDDKDSGPSVPQREGQVHE